MNPRLLALLLAPSLTMAAASANAPLQQRIDEAQPGDTIVVDGGRHQGALRIEKPITLKGDGNPAIIGDRSGHVIHALASDIAIEGFTIRNSGSNLSQDHAGIMAEGDRARIANNRFEDCLHGIYLKRSSGGTVEGNRIVGKSVKLVPIEDVLSADARPIPGSNLCAVNLDVNQRGNGIHLWSSSGNQLIDNEISNTRDGIYFSFSDRTTVRGNLVRRVRYGLHYMYSDENVFESNRFEENAAGAALMYSHSLFVRNNAFLNNRGRRAYGLLLQSLDDSTFIGNRLDQNTVGIYLENSNRNRFLRNRIQANYIGVRLTASSQDNGFDANRFVRNLHSVELDRASSANDWAPDGSGNFWSEARPIDLDADQVSEFAHRESDLLGPLRRKFPAVGLLSQTPALQLLSFVHSRSPLPGVPAITDPAPLTRPGGPSDKDD